jgi:hypothetical protein
MTSAVSSVQARGALLRHSRWDALLVALAALHGVVLVAFPLMPVVAVGVWWNSNTIAHYFIHAPFFRSLRLNVLFGLYLSALLGIPQTIWRERHLAHHAGVAWKPRFSSQLIAETALVVGLWLGLLAFQPRFFLTVYIPGYIVGLTLCYLHGYFEHVHGTISHHGRLYNLLFFNDGYHVEHHTSPRTHWTRLPQRLTPSTPTSGWPAVLRWLDAFSLEGQERWVLRSPRLQAFLIRSHERAFRQLLLHTAKPARVAIIGGGLFPRTLLVLRRLLPDARFVIIDRSAENIETARRFVNGNMQVEKPGAGWHAFAALKVVDYPESQAGPRKHGTQANAIAPESSSTDELVQFLHAVYEPAMVKGCDLAVFPLAFVGNRPALYREPPAPAVLIHDWLWHRRGTSAIVSLFLLKRLNLVRP